MHSSKHALAMITNLFCPKTKFAAFRSSKKQARAPTSSTKIPSDNFLQLKSLREAFTEAEQAKDQKRTDALNAEEKRLMQSLSPEERYQYLIEETADGFATDVASVQAYLEQLCDSKDPVVKAAFAEGWILGATQMPPFLEALVEKQLGKPDKHLEQIKRQLARPNIDGPDTLQ